MLCPGGVVRHGLGFTVLLAVKLYYQPRFETYKIHNIFINGVLTPKLKAGKPASPQMIPKFPFRLGRLRSHRPCISE